MKIRNLQAAGELLARGREEAEKMLAADRANLNARRTVANFSDKLGDYYAVLADDKSAPPDQRQSHMQEANALYRRSVELVNEIQPLGQLTAEDKKSLENLTRKLAPSAQPQSSSGTRASPR